MLLALKFIKHFYYDQRERKEILNIYHIYRAELIPEML
jgi:hypothetical protein